MPLVSDVPCHTSRRSPVQGALRFASIGRGLACTRRVALSLAVFTALLPSPTLPFSAAPAALPAVRPGCRARPIAAAALRRGAREDGRPGRGEAGERSPRPCRAGLVGGAEVFSEAAKEQSWGDGAGALTEEAKAQFWRDGFLLVENLNPLEDVAAVRGRLDGLFRGEFDTGVYPDEWHWREGISLPDAPREICNAWKADRTIAAFVQAERFGRLSASLMAWPFTRLAQDSVIWKPAGAGAVAYHQDGGYIAAQFAPLRNNSLTIWNALDHADAQNGVLEYARGSHLWPAPQKGASSSFHGSSDYMAGMLAAAAAAGLAPEDVEVVRLTVPEGAALLHHQDVWHGSASNTSPDRPRRALAVHTLRGDVSWAPDRKPTYIYGRYKLEGEAGLHEEFFPTVPFRST